MTKLPNLSNPRRVKKRVRRIAWRLIMGRELRPKQRRIYDAMSETDYPGLTG